MFGKKTTNEPVAETIQEKRAAAPVKKVSKTQVIVNYDVGFGNALYIRGRGANLSWEKGIMLQNVSNNEWVWQTDASFSACEFKILINDSVYEIGDNHQVLSGAVLKFTPSF